VLQGKIKVRSATRADADAVFRLLGELGYTELDRAHFDAALESVLHHSEMILLLAETEDVGVIGFASLSHRPQLRLGGTLLTIDELSVTEAARGLGVGRLLLAEARKIAEELGARRLQLEQRRSRESYRRGFYVKNGFEEADSALMRFKFPVS
jgi:GNAT superfamily N-acetyltransferase